jgi:hypothetical protein
VSISGASADGGEHSVGMADVLANGDCIFGGDWSKLLTSKRGFLL